MAYNQEIDERIRKIVSRWKNIETKKMFGGVCYLQDGKMFCGVNKDFLILRLGEKNADEAIKLNHTSPFYITKRPMKGWLTVEEEGFSTPEELRTWLKIARDFVKALPREKRKKRTGG